MTIVVTRRQKKRTGVEQAFGAAREISRHKLASMNKFLDAKEKQENRLNAATIRRYAKKHELELRYHPKPWIFRSYENRIQIAMPAGYFAKVDGVLHQLVAV